MHHINATTEHDMVASFLKAEMNSRRFGEAIRALLQRDGIDRRIVDEPNVSDQEENRYRIKLLGDLRGYKQCREFFPNDVRCFFSFFPNDVRWYRAEISRAELAGVRYINYPYWVALSNGTRLPRVAAENVQAGVEVTGRAAESFLDVARALSRGVVFPEPILVSTDRGSGLVILEGHVRLTGYFLVPERIPEEMQVVVGYSPNMVGWYLY
jgi:hypothetical protein